MKHLIIGGVAGGATAAARIRRLDESAEIILVEKGKYISYANCGLPYYIGGAITDRQRLFVQTPESFGRRFNVDVKVENEAVAIDPVGKVVTIRRADGSAYTETYDKLLLSPGASPYAGWGRMMPLENMVDEYECIEGHPISECESLGCVHAAERAALDKEGLYGEYEFRDPRLKQTHHFPDLQICR